ncbi:MAG: RNA-binding protein [Elusimicrobia bacterium]|nr:RNA-binding protein [Elusimicrobiota bacterium]
MSIYVGNLSSDVTEEDLREAFKSFGEIKSVNIISDKFTKQPRGFGFVEMMTDDATKAAIAGMNGKDLKGKPLTVNEARPKSDSGKRGFGGGGHFGGKRDFGGGGGGNFSGRRSFGSGGSRGSGRSRTGGGGHRGG